MNISQNAKKVFWWVEKLSSNIKYLHP